MNLRKVTSAAFSKTLLTMLTLTCICLGPLKTKAQCPQPFFYEGFESGSIAPTWTALGTFSTFAVTVNTVLPNSGGFKLHMTGLSNHLQGIFTNFSPATPSTVSWFIYPYQITGGSNYFVLGDAAVSFSHCLVFCCWIGSTSTTGNIRFYSSSTTYTDYPTNNQQWHKIELRNINYTAMTFDIWINNSLFTTAYPFRSSSLSNVSQLHLYNLTAAGSSAWDDIMIGDGLAGSVTPSQPSCFGGSNGTATVTAMGGTSPYTYSWSTSSTASAVTNLQANTTYSVKVTDANNCSFTKTFTLSQPTQVTATINTQSVTCHGYSNGQATVSASGGFSPYTFTWTNNSVGPITYSLTAGTQTVWIKDAKGCLSSSVITIGGPQFPLGITNTVANVSCFGAANGSIVAQGTGGNGAYTYSWNPSAGASPIRNNIAAGSYTLYIFDKNQCTYTNVFTVTQPTSVTAQFSTDVITCVSPGGATVNVAGGTPPYTYTWQTGGGSGINLVTNSPGKHSVTVVDNQGCNSIFSVTISSNLVTPTLTLSSSKPTICKGETVSISVTGNGDNYLWQDGSGNTVLTITPTVSGNYSVTASFIVNGCTATAAFFQTVSACSHVNEYFLQENLIYPNPASDKINISTDFTESYRITTPEGRLISEGTLHAGENEIDLRHLSAGIYFFVLSRDTKTYSKKFVKS